MPTHDDLTAADASLARRARRITTPARRLVNAPHLLVAAIVVVWITCSMLYAVTEGKGPIESLWWGIVTGSTVGYGDFYPSTTVGRGIASVLIVSMLVLLPIAIGHVIANLVLDRNQFTHDEQVALATTLDSSHERIDRIEHLVLAALREQHGDAWVQERLAEHEAADGRSVDVGEETLGVFSRPES